MYKNNKILALITARGGSKGIPRKNIKPLNGIPLINWTINAANQSAYIDRLILTTDDIEIADIAINAGCEVPFMRPSSLATDTATSMDVILHALENIEPDYDYLLLLQPTSPFRSTAQIDSIIEQGINNLVPITVSVSESKKHPSFMYTLEGNRKLTPILPNQQHGRRQDMPKVFEYNGALYLAYIPHLKTVKSFKGEGVQAFVMDTITSVDIDEPLDWQFSEFLIEEGYIS